MKVENKRRELCKRFNLADGQFFAYYKLKNQRWHLDDREFGYGDLTEDNIQQIQAALQPGEIFKGYNEHHGTDWQQRKNPMIVITHNVIDFPTVIR